jgi:hypothetical protein
MRLQRKREDSQFASLVKSSLQTFIVFALQKTDLVIKEKA